MLTNHRHEQSMRRERGDTLIEVLFSITIFSLIMVGAMALMNQGVSSATRSLQITLARQQVDSQAETLRFLSASYVANFKPGTITPSSATPSGQYATVLVRAESSSDTATNFSASTGVTCPAAPAGSFILNSSAAAYPATMNLVAATTYPQVTVSGSTVTGQGIWIEAVRSDRDAVANTRYVDYHIRACWGAPGTNVPMKIATIVRLYEPSSY